ncbi:MAG: glutamate-5-semialdehyde dehydrogenase, partial [Verrucomicrobia bacterium]
MTEIATDLEQQVQKIAAQARAASLVLATTPTAAKNAFLDRLAEMIETSAEQLKVENGKDLEAGDANGLSTALLDRLRLTDKRIAEMATGVRQVRDLPDPVGVEIERTEHANGISIRKIRVPIGVVGIIYESRPNVTVDCSVLCLKSGNAAILRGGKEAFHTNTVLSSLIRKALQESSLPEAAVQLIPTTDRRALLTLLKLDEQIDCIIPRGGEGLIRFVAETSTIPVIKHYKGVCAVYLDRRLDPAMADAIVINAKCQRPSVCNAIENLFVHADIAESILPAIGRSLIDRGVELRVDPAAAAILSRHEIECTPVSEEDWSEEYIDLILAVGVVPSLKAAIDAINTFGSAHSDAIVTSDPEAAETFLAGVDSATVYWNASTRFTDGFEFGLGAEIGIS